MMNAPAKQPLTCIDLFAGCGGFSLGLHRAGFNILAAIDFEPKAVEVYQANFTGTRVLCRDLTQFAPQELAQQIGTNRVDVIAGGPPCQGFSQVRQRDGANNGSRMIHDPRRTLYQQYFEYVDYFKPKLFVMENVQMFIHPTQNRSLTPREAACIQRLPDWFQFPVAVGFNSMAC